MTRIFRVFFFVLSCQAAFGKIVIPTDYIPVAPTNAADHSVSFSYDATNSFVTVITPYTRGELMFEGADLECTNSVHRFDLPIQAIHPAVVEGEKDVILIWFMMDRQLVRESTLRIRFRKGLEKATEYILLLKRFIPEVELSPKK